MPKIDEVVVCLIEKITTVDIRSQTLSQLDGNSMGGESGNPRNPTGAAETSGFAVATVPPRQRRMGTVVPPQGLILPENSPPTKSLLMEFPASEQETSEHQPLTKSPSRFASPEDVKSRLSGAKKAVENLEVELPSEFECCFCTTKVVY
ncbi:hypothetical protein RUM43_001845 [Polyplax serrata]|uniref:Uncharacterized protein n=1 Tax=Polyplax serrata TaxID=468196 RepID=A0AAN8SEG3_POLSC